MTQLPPIAIIGLGYVGLPLAVEFGKIRPVIGFDIDARRIAELQAGNDHTLEVEADDLSAAENLTLTDKVEDLRAANIYIVTVPTPIDRHNQPDLDALRSASQMIGGVLAMGDLVIYESTVYPGATEEDCVPVLETQSGMTLNEDFTVGYSPERINPGDRARRLPDIIKVTSGSTPEAAACVARLYDEIITAGTYQAESIRVAEAAKIIENTQRDLNIALMNELAKIFNYLDIDTHAVLRAARTKWNFLPFEPGLVGGHCIGVDPFYLTHKAQAVGYHPEIILAGRRINDTMSSYVATRLIKAMLSRKLEVQGASILVIGLTFKEDCPDLRNTKVVELVAELQSYGCRVDVHDPHADPVEAKSEYGIELIEAPRQRAYDAVLLAVPHNTFRTGTAVDLRGFGKIEHVFFDMKGVFGQGESDVRL